MSAAMDCKEMVDTVQTKVARDHCTGCTACASICPVAAIEMVADKEGFKFPQVESERCINCGACLRVCPVLHPGAPRTPLAVYAAKANDDALRMQSSSGGIFTLLARQTLDGGGVVYGAGWKRPEFIVTHKRVTSETELAELRGSKYVQSELGTTFKQAKKDLENGRKVLFSGTPCQVLGLKRYLQHTYDNLICVDFICHSVASPLLFKLYKESVTGEATISKFTFRDKSCGWSPIHYLKFILSDGRVQTKKFGDTFLGKGWALGWFCRWSCFSCPKEFTSQSDITLSDAWGCEKFAPEIADAKGVSLIFLNTQEGQNRWRGALKKRECSTRLVDAEAATELNPCAWKAREMSDSWNFTRRQRKKFFAALQGTWQIDRKEITNTLHRSLRKKVISRCYRLWKRVRVDEV